MPPRCIPYIVLFRLITFISFSHLYRYRICRWKKKLLTRNQIKRNRKKKKKTCYGLVSIVLVLMHRSHFRWLFPDVRTREREQHQGELYVSHCSRLAIYFSVTVELLEKRVSQGRIVIGFSLFFLSTGASHFGQTSTTVYEVSLKKNTKNLIMISSLRNQLVFNSHLESTLIQEITSKVQLECLWQFQHPTSIIRHNAIHSSDICDRAIF